MWKYWVERCADFRFHSHLSNCCSPKRHQCLLPLTRMQTPVSGRIWGWWVGHAWSWVFCIMWTCFNRSSQELWCHRMVHAFEVPSSCFQRLCQQAGLSQWCKDYILTPRHRAEAAECWRRGCKRESGPGILVPYQPLAQGLGRHFPSPPLPEPLTYNKAVGLGALTSFHAHSSDLDLVIGVFFKIPDRVTARLCLLVLLIDSFGVMVYLCWSKTRGGRSH